MPCCALEKPKKGENRSWRTCGNPANHPSKKHCCNLEKHARQFQKTYRLSELTKEGNCKALLVSDGAIRQCGNRNTGRCRIPGHAQQDVDKVLAALKSADILTAAAPAVKTRTKSQDEHNKMADAARAAEPSLGPLTRAKLRKQMTRAGFRPEPDQHALHIIALHNGGANHLDNYHGFGGGVLNSTLQHRYDTIQCYWAGLLKTRKAVAISKRLGTFDLGPHAGMTAEQLYHLGEQQWKVAFLNMRSSES